MGITKVIRKKESGSARRWEVPNVEDIQTVVSEDGGVLSSTPLTAEQIEQIQKEAYKEAYDEGFAKGYNDGKTESQSQVQQQLDLMNAVLNQCAEPVRELDQEVEHQLVQLAIAMTRQLVRREIKTEPGQIVAIVREAMQVLPVSSRDVRIFLHPEDSQITKQALAATDNQYWKLQDDPTLNRGDCRIQTQTSSIDASMERRLASIIANLLGGERAQDGTAPDPVPDEGKPAQ